MKYYFFLLMGVIYACTPSTSDSNQVRLEALKKEHGRLTEEINALETEIGSTKASIVPTKFKEVSVKEVVAAPFDHYIKTQGIVEAADNILTSAQAMGVVTAVYVKEGQSVSKGSILGQIDNAVLIQNIESVKAQLQLAESVYLRQQKLWDQKIGTEVQYLQAKSSKEALQSQLGALMAQNEMTRIKSPISGTVDEVFIKIGENISPGMPAVRVVNTSNLKFTIGVSEAYINNIKKGNRVIVNISDLKQDFDSQVIFTSKNIDPLSRTFVAEIKLPSTDDLRPNMTGVAKVIFFTAFNAVSIPINIVQDVNGEKVVYVAEQEGNQFVARKKVVTVEGVYDNRAQVNGLNPGDKVIVSGYQGLNNGDFIKI